MRTSAKSKSKLKPHFTQVPQTPPQHLSMHPLPPKQVRPAPSLSPQPPYTVNIQDLKIIKQACQALEYNFAYRQHPPQQALEQLGPYLLQNVYINTPTPPNVDPHDNSPASRHYQRQVRGYASEMYFKYILQYYQQLSLQKLNQPVYILHNIMIPTRFGTTQIDFLIITPKNIFCVECKSLFGIIEINQGVISSNSNNSELTTKPWAQNMAHILGLKNILELRKPLTIHNCVFLYSIGRITKSNLQPGDFILSPVNAIQTLFLLNEKNNFMQSIEDPQALYNHLLNFTPSLEDELNHIKMCQR